jgi:hypothetical protein
MKKLFIMAMLLLTVTLPAQTGTNESVPEVLSLSEQIYSDVKESLKGLGEALEVGASHVYTFLVKQQMIIAVTYSLFGVIGLIFAMNWFKAYNNVKEIWFLQVEYESDNPTGIMIIRTAQIAFSIIMIVAFIVNLNVVITGFFNPEYGAMKEILTLIK